MHHTGPTLAAGSCRLADPSKRQYHPGTTRRAQGGRLLLALSSWVAGMWRRHNVGVSDSGVSAASWL